MFEFKTQGEKNNVQQINCLRRKIRHETRRKNALLWNYARL